MHKRIEMVAVPKASSVEQVFAAPDYMDAFAVDIPPGVELDIESITRKVLFESAPWWVESLMDLRNAVVKWFGLKTGDTTKEEVMRNFSLSNPNMGLFNIYGYSESEVILGEDDKHLDFRVSLLIERENRRLVLTTVVQFNNWLGRLYFLPVSFFHRIIVKAMLKKIRW